ncbi:MAG TPA: amino acid racemase [Gammaproteobacteria bacterium]
MNDKTESMIGIVSGLGPGAGLDLAQKVIDQTIACRDQEHLPLMLVSIPERVSNRTDFILGHDPVNPAEGIIYALEKLYSAGATVVAIPCNTSHADSIFHMVSAYVSALARPVTLVNMIDEVCRHIELYHSGVENVGVLSTTGTAAAGIYRKALDKIGRRIVELDPGFQEQLNEAIHSKTFGLKAQSNPASARATAILERCIGELVGNGADICVLACTELPLAIPGVVDPGVPLLDSTLVLARALVRAVRPEQLKSWSVADVTDSAALHASTSQAESAGKRPASKNVEEVAS